MINTARHINQRQAVQTFFPTEKRQQAREPLNPFPQSYEENLLVQTQEQHYQTKPKNTFYQKKS